MEVLEIRQANLEDVEHQEAIVRILNTYSSDIMGAGKSLSSEVAAELIPGLQKHPTTRILLAFRGPHAVGIAVSFIGFSTFAARPILNLHDLAVLPESRGQGVGKALLEAVTEMAWEIGCAKVTLEVRDNNTLAQRLYSRMGFVGAGEPQRLDSMWFIEKKRS